MSGLELPFREREINGTSYRAYTLQLDAWADLTEYLAGMLGDPMSSLLRGDSVLPENVQIGRIDIEAMIAGLVKKLNKKAILSLVAHMAKSIRANGSILDPTKQNIWWPSHMKDLAPVVGLFLEAQYSDFYEGLSDSMPQTSAQDLDLLERGNDSSPSLSH